jgi:hypothetical protein
VDGGAGLQGVRDILYGKGVGDDDFGEVFVVEEVDEEFIEGRRGVSDPRGGEH